MLLSDRRTEATGRRPQDAVTYSGVSVEKEKSNINPSINTLINNQACGCIVFTLRSRQIECTSVDSSLYKSNSQGGLTASMLAKVGAPFCRGRTISFGIHPLVFSLDIVTS